jgi:hypothetical protein
MAVGRRAEGSDERSLITRAYSRFGAGAHSPAAPPSRLVNDTVSHPGPGSPAAHLEPSTAAGSHPRAAGRATNVPFTAVLTGLKRTPTDNIREARPALFPCLCR